MEELSVLNVTVLRLLGYAKVPATGCLKCFVGVEKCEGGMFCSNALLQKEFSSVLQFFEIVSNIVNCIVVDYVYSLFEVAAIIFIYQILKPLYAMYIN